LGVFVPLNSRRECQWFWVYKPCVTWVSISVVTLPSPLFLFFKYNLLFQSGSFLRNVLLRGSEKYFHVSMSKQFFSFFYLLLY
jgi:hypothetical protein